MVSMKNTKPRKAWLSLVIITLTVFLVEVVIMILLRSSFFHMSVWMEVISDSITLILLLLPTLYYFMLRPMAREIAIRERMERELQEANDQSESRVKQRTAELEGANSKLESEIVERQQAEMALQQAND